MSTRLERLQELRLAQLGGEDREPPTEDEINAAADEFAISTATIRNYLDVLEEWIRDPSEKNEQRKANAVEMMIASSSARRINELPDS